MVGEQMSRGNWKKTRPIQAYFLALEPLASFPPLMRWIEHVSISFEIEDMFTAYTMSPMGGWDKLSPYMHFDTRKAMMTTKNQLNYQIVLESEPENWDAWGVTVKAAKEFHGKNFRAMMKKRNAFWDEMRRYEQN